MNKSAHFNQQLLLKNKEKGESADSDGACLIDKAQSIEKPFANLAGVRRVK